MGTSNSQLNSHDTADIFHYVPDINDFRDKYIHFDQLLDYSDIIDLRGSFPPLVNIEKWNEIHIYLYYLVLFIMN